MNCKFCNADLAEDALFCQECGAKVEDSPTEDAPNYCKCGAELAPGVKFCNQCGAAVTDNTIEDNAGVERQTNTNKIRSFGANAIAYIKSKPKLFGIIGAVVLVLIIGISIGGSVLHNNSKPAKTTTTSSSSSSKSGSSSSSGALTENLKEAMVASALMSEVKTKFPIADAGSTKYKINKTEQKSGYTIVYGKLYLYDKYGKATTGRSDKSGSYTRTFEVKIKNGTVSSCTIK